MKAAGSMTCHAAAPHSGPLAEMEAGKKVELIPAA